jgi:tetratricopeptide (TPR) repeat protein
MAAQRGEGNRLAIGLPVDEQRQLAAALQTDLVWVQRLIGTVDGENAQASMPADREKIFMAVQRMLPGGFEDLNTAVKAALREWTYEAGVRRLGELSETERCRSTLAVALGQYCEDQGKYRLAENLLRKAVDERRAAFGTQDERTLEAMSQLASVWESMDNYGEAETLMSEVVDNNRQLGGRHPRTLAALTNIGLLHRKMADYDRAETELVEAVAGQREVLGDDHPDTLQSISLLGALYSSMGSFERAETLMKEAVDRRRLVLGETHPQTLESVNNLGALYEEIGRFSEGEPLMRFAEQSRRRILGDDHPGTLDSIGCLGLLLSRMERNAEAEPLLREAVDRSRAVLGSTHPDTLIALFNLAELLEAMSCGPGAYADEAVALFEEELRGHITREDNEEAADSARQLHRRLVRHEMAEKVRELEELCQGLGLSLEETSSSDDEDGNAEPEQ